MLARSKFRHFSQPNRWKKQQREPGAARDVTSRRAEEYPRYTGNDENNKRRDPPSSVNRIGAPGTCEDKKRRNHCEKKKDVIEIHHERSLKS